MYSTEEYNKSLTGASNSSFKPYTSHPQLDKEWSREETDYLFDMAREYDVRFLVMHDRYNFPGGVERTVEVNFLFFSGSALLNRSQDLKHRYYGVCRKLLRTRPWVGDESSKAQLLSSFNFDKGNNLL